MGVLNNKQLKMILMSIREYCYTYLKDCKRCKKFKGIGAEEICDDNDCLAKTACGVAKRIINYIEGKVC